MAETLTKKENFLRAAHIDALRIIACLMVIFNHTNDRGFLRYALDDLHSIIWWFDTFFSAACKAGVPIFFMITGANLLGKQESYTKTFSRSKKILLCLITWSLIYFFIDCYPREKFLIETLKKMTSGNYWHLWYLYAYITFLFTAPVLKKFSSHMEIKEFYLIFTLGIIFTFAIPIIEKLFIVINGNFKPSWIISNIFFYPVLGYFIDKKIEKSFFSKKLLAFLWILNILIFIAAETAEWNYLIKHSGDKNENIIRTTCMINAVTLFTTIKFIFMKYKISDLIKNLISKIGQLTFGIYLSHIIFLWKIPALLSFWKYIERIGGGISRYIFMLFVSRYSFIRVKKSPVH